MEIWQLINGLHSLAQLCHNQSITAKTKYASGLWDDMDSIATEALNIVKAKNPKEPLTLEDTLGMNGRPEYLCWKDGGEWVLIHVASVKREQAELVHRDGSMTPIRFVLEGGGQLYRRPPMED